MRKSSITGALPALTVACNESGGFCRSRCQPRARSASPTANTSSGVLVAGRRADRRRTAPRARPSTHSPGMARTPVDQPGAGVERGLGEAQVALRAEVVEGGPRGGHRQASPRALHPRRGVEAAEPVVEHEGLVAAQRLGAVEQHGRALGGVAELVEVGRDRGDARRPGSPTAGRRAELLDERAGRSRPCTRRCGSWRRPSAASGSQLRDRVDDALRVLRRAADDEHGVRRSRRPPWRRRRLASRRAPAPCARWTPK